MHRTPKWLLTAVYVLVFSSFAGLGAVQAQTTDEQVTAVCIVAFETAPYVEYLTQEEIAEIEALVEDPAEPPPPEIVGYPDPETGSCATENGELKDYDPDVYTPVCIPSGPERDGPLVVQWALTHYIIPESDVILADPVTGACPGSGTGETGENDDAAAKQDSSDDGTGTGEIGESETTALPDTGAGVVPVDASGQYISASILLAALCLLGAGVGAVHTRTR